MQDKCLEGIQVNRTVFVMKKEALKSFYEEMMKGIILRARVCWHRYKEKTKHVLTLEKRKKIKSCINSKWLELQSQHNHLHNPMY